MAGQLSISTLTDHGVTYAASFPSPQCFVLACRSTSALDRAEHEHGETVSNPDPRIRQRGRLFERMSGGSPLPVLTGRKLAEAKHPV